MLRSALAMLSGLLAAAACASNPRFGGPLPLRSQHPAQLTVLHMDPASAAPLPAGDVALRIDAAYSSLFLGGEGGGNAFEMDGEVLRAGAKARVGLGQGFELGLEVPVLHTTGGFLDGFLIDWHDLWGLPGQGRGNAPRGRYSVRADRQGVTVFEVEERSLELGDVPMSLQWAFLPLTDERPWGAALRGAVEWPSGDDDDGFGNGGFDAALGVVGEARWGCAALTGYLQHSFAHTPSRARGGHLHYADVTAAGAGLELALGGGVAALLQTSVETSTLRELGFRRVSDPQWLLWTGVRARLWPRVSVEVALGEDLSGYVAPDFTAYVGIALGSPLP